MIKNIRLGRAENLSDEIKKQFNLPERGLVMIESKVECGELKENFVPIKRDGIRGYLLSLADFNDVFIYNGRRYYKNKSDALMERKKGDRIYYDPYLKAYYIIRPSKNSSWEIN